MTDSKTMRIVPSGKVYRQMFDAQLQLNRSLTKLADVKDKRGEQALVKVGQIPLPEIRDIHLPIPLVHLTKDETKHGILTPRQQTWAGGFPNDPYTENPILYREYKNFVDTRKGVNRESVEAGKEVERLPDVVVPAIFGSDIIDRITYSRRVRHESTLEEMHQELAVINFEIEPKIEDASEEVIQRLAIGNMETVTLMSKIALEEDLLGLRYQDLRAIWEGIQEFGPAHQECIADMDAQLKRLEEERMTRIRLVFQAYAKKFEQISYLIGSDLQRFLDKESQALNQTCLSNRRALADLTARLMAADIEREKIQHTQWYRQLEEWRSLNIDKTLAKFKEFMESDEVVNPEGVQRVLDLMMSELQTLNDQRLQCITAIGEMKPPHSTKSAVYKWRQQVQDITKELDYVMQLHMSRLHEEMERVCQMCLGEMDHIKDTLLDLGVLTDDRVQQVTEEQMLPLIGDRQRVFENNLDTMESLQEEHMKRMDRELHSLFKFSQGAAHLWDVHEIGLARQERNLQERLEEGRREHDVANQEREANLDMVMDRMRQDSNESALRDSLGKAFDMLEGIGDSYVEFHKAQTEVVHTYPYLVERELDTLDASVCKYFTLDRLHPEDRKRRDEEAAAAAEAEANADQPDYSATRLTIREPRKSKGKIKVDKDLPEELPKPVEMAVAEVLSTKRGNTFYVLTVAEEEPIPADASAGPSDQSLSSSKTQQAAAKKQVSATKVGSKLTQSGSKGSQSDKEGEGREEGEEGEKESLLIPVSAPEEEALPDYIECIHLPAAHLLHAKRTTRMNLLDYLESWGDQAKERSSSVVVAKCEELNSELDLRLHLHQPRSRRAELDVHNVRAAELVMHSERVSRHCKGIVQSLDELRAKFSAMSNEHNTLAKKFQQDIEALEVIFINATKSAQLVKLQNQLVIQLDQFMTVIRTSLRQFRQHLDNTLQMLRESNARFIKSFKLFSDGGNFCPEEIDEYRKRLEKMSSKIDSAEGGIMSELEGMESKRLDVASKVANEFEDRFKSHLFDLLFMEKMAQWLTNTQVRIKADVADSNTQAQALARNLLLLERRIDACHKPHFEKESITAEELNDFLKTLMEDFHKRSRYLKCLKPPMPSPGPASVQDGTPSRTGKISSEDPSVTVIKSILSSLQAVADAEKEKEKEQSATSVNPTPSSQLVGGEGKERSPSISVKGKASSMTRRNTNSDLTETHRHTSGLRRPVKPVKLDQWLFTRAEDRDRGETSGDQNEKNEKNNFIALIQLILWETLKGLETTSEIYYKQKGARPVTRPQAIQETHEQSMDVCAKKLVSYFKQSDDYHNECLQEFRQQLTEVEQLASKVPALFLNMLVSKHLEDLNQARAKLKTHFLAKEAEIKAKQAEHEARLRPSIGHPNLEPKLRALCEEEEECHQNYLDLIEEHADSQQSCVVEHAQRLLNSLTAKGEELLFQFDKLLVIDDIERGRVEPKKLPPSELMRRQKAGEPLTDEEAKEALPKGKGYWIGLPTNEMQGSSRPTKIQRSPTVNTKKTTQCHSATVKARDNAYQDYKVQFDTALLAIEEEKQRQTKEEEHWTTKWRTSVQSVKELYYSSQH